MYCSKCGKEILEGSQFCSSCGNKVGQINGEIKEKKKGLTKTQFFICLIIMIIAVAGLGVYMINNMQQNQKQKQEDINKKVEQEMRDLQRSEFKNPKGSLGEQSIYRISPDGVDW